MGIPDHLTCLLGNLYAGQEARVRTRHETTDLFKLGKGVRQWCILSPCLFNICRVHNVKCQAGWTTSWNQDCREKYQQPQICRWYHSNSRNWRGTKEPLDEDERGEWQNWLETQHSKNYSHGIWSYHFTPNLGKKWKQWQLLFSWAPKSLWTVIVAMKLKDACSLEGEPWQI